MRNIAKMQTRNDGARTLFESVIAPELVATFKEWIAENSDGVLIGGLAISYYGKPRYTQDIDILYQSEERIPQQVAGFRRSRAHAFVDRQSGVEIEVLSPSFLGIAQVMVDHVFATARTSDGIKIASPSALVALKLARLSPQDKADIIDLIHHEAIDLTGFGLNQDQIARYLALVADADDLPPELPHEEPYPE